MEKAKHQASPSEMAVFLKDKIDSSGKGLKDLAREMGFNNSNFISMLKSGNAKVPLDKVVPIARALGVDPACFMKIALRQFFKDTSDEIWDLFDGIVSLNETKLIRAVRAVYGDDIPDFTEPQIEEFVALLVRLNPPR